MKIWSLTINGASCSFKENMLTDFMLEDIKNSDVNDDIKIEVKEMTEEEFNHLPEFQGY